MAPRKTVPTSPSNGQSVRNVIGSPAKSSRSVRGNEDDEWEKDSTQRFVVESAPQVGNNIGTDSEVNYF